MKGFLSEFLRGSDAAYTVIVMDEGYMEQPRRYHIRPFRLLAGAAGTLLAVALLVTLVLAFTPMRRLIPGYGTIAMEQSARRNAERAAALQDTLREQRSYLRHLQSLMTGPVDSAFVAEAQQDRGVPAAAGTSGMDNGAVTGEPSALPRPERAPAFGVTARSPFASVGIAEEPAMAGAEGSREESLRPPQFPVLPPVEGFVTRGFETQTGHYAVDIAVEEGTPVRSIGDGYVVMADRTQDGGHAIAVQHSGGYLSLYKHNSTLRKTVGEYVQARAVIAESGNSGEVTTGPHLHVELWHNGLAQDPAAYFIGG